jgi:hypothetical protein
MHINGKILNFDHSIKKKSMFQTFMIDFIIIPIYLL